MLHTRRVHVPAKYVYVEMVHGRMGMHASHNVSGPVATGRYGGLLLRCGRGRRRHEVFECSLVWRVRGAEVSELTA